MVKFYDTRGRLTAYALGCGYIAQSGSLDGVNTQLWREHGKYHVRQHNHATGKRVVWDVLDTLKEARRVFDALCRDS